MHRCYNFSKWRRLYFNSVDTPNPREYFGFNNAEDSEMMAHYNTDGVFFLPTQANRSCIIRALLIATLVNTIVQNATSNVLELNYAVTAINELSRSSI